MDNPLLLAPPSYIKDKKADILRLLLNHNSKLDKNLIIGCISYRINKPKKKDKDHKMVVNKLVEVYNDHIALADRIEKFVPVFKTMPEESIHLMSKIPYNTDLVLLHDMLKSRNLPNMMFRLRKTGRLHYLDIKKPVAPKICPTRTLSCSSFDEESPGYEDPGYLDIGSLDD